MWQINDQAVHVLMVPFEIGSARHILNQLTKAYKTFIVPPFNIPNHIYVSDFITEYRD